MISFLKQALALSIVLHILVTRVQGGSAPRMVDSEFSNLEPRWCEAMTHLDVPGLAVVVVRGEEVLLLDGWGIRDPSSDAPPDPDTMFYIASCTKPYTAMGITILRDQGVLTWDDTVRKHLPRFRLSDEGLGGRLTLRDLACHRMGINHSAIVFNDAFTGQMTEEWYDRLLPKAVVSQKVAYSNVHFTLLGRILGAASGKPWRDFLEEHLFVPAGMTRTTGYASRMYGDSNVARPLVRQDGRWEITPLVKTDRTMHAAGGLGTTARDLGQWMLLHLNKGRVNGRQVVSEAGINEMLTRQSDFPTRGKAAKLNGFGLGWMLGEYRGRPLVAHGGGYIGASAYISMLPQDGVGVAALVNISEPANGIIDVITADVLDRLLQLPTETDLLISSRKRAKQLLNSRREIEAQTVSVSGEHLSLPIERYIGTYVDSDWGNISVTQKDGALHLVAGDLSLSLHSRGTDRFEVRRYLGDLGQEGEFEIVDGGVKALSLAPTGDETVRFLRHYRYHSAE